MKKKAVALVSGGIDSTLAVCMVKEQGVEVEGLNLQTMFSCCKLDASKVAHEIKIPLTVVKAGDDYLKLIQKPKYGYGRGVNPCVDCRIYMFHLAKKFMEDCGASFLISGEVLEQRPMSQKKKDLENIEQDAGLKGLILRPLSAQYLPPTLPEKEGIIDRNRLFGIRGRSRKKILELAAKYGIKNPPDPSAGCALTSPDFAKKVRDVFEHSPDYQSWEFEILKLGRHFRLDEETKLIIARNHEQNLHFENVHPQGVALLSCENFGGPHAFLIGSKTEENFQLAGSLMLRYAMQNPPEVCQIQAEWNGRVEQIEIRTPATNQLVDHYRIV